MMIREFIDWWDNHIAAIQYESATSILDYINVGSSLESASDSRGSQLIDSKSLASVSKTPVLIKGKGISILLIKLS